MGGARTGREALEVPWEGSVGLTHVWGAGTKDRVSEDRRRLLR